MGDDKNDVGRYTDYVNLNVGACRDKPALVECFCRGRGLPARAVYLMR